ncbi:nucleotidyltransferase domain-containing protein [Kitasatospora sp. NPDC054939]
MDTERAARQLDLIAGTLGLARRLGIDLRLRGGWAMDFLLGTVTRDHEDVDWFVDAADAPALTGGLLELGHRPLPGPPPDQQLDFVKDGLESGFALVERTADGRVLVAGGPFAGSAWPDGMLDGPTGRLGGVECPIVAAAAQIEIKRMMPVWDPRRPRRPKDAEDIARITAFLATRPDGG